MKKNNSYANTFGRILKIQRKLNNLSQERLAEIADLHRTFISQLESGKKTPTLNVIISIAQAFNLKPSELIKIFEDEIDGI